MAEWKYGIMLNLFKYLQSPYSHGPFLSNQKTIKYSSRLKVAFFVCLFLKENNSVPYKEVVRGLRRNCKVSVLLLLPLYVRTGEEQPEMKKKGGGLINKHKND